MQVQEEDEKQMQEKDGQEEEEVEKCENPLQRTLTTNDYRKQKMT